MTNIPVWLENLVNQICAEALTPEAEASLGCHSFYAPEADEWEVTLFANATEILGGAHDGLRLQPNLAVDLSRLPQLFDEVTGFHSQTEWLGPDDDLGPHVAVEGRWRSHRLWLRILSTAPACVPAGQIHDSQVARTEAA